MVIWEHSYETEAYEEYGEDAWEDDDNMVPNYTDLLDLKKKIKQLFPDMETTIKYGEKKIFELEFKL